MRRKARFVRIAGIALLPALGFAFALSGVAAGTSSPASSIVLPSDPVLALAVLNRKLADLDTDEQADKAELDAMGGPISAAHARVVANGRAFYKMTRAGLLPVGGGFGALVTYANHVERARRVVTSDVEQETRLRARATDLARQIERIARDRVGLSAQRAALDARRAAIDDERRRQAAFDRAFESSTGPGADYVAVYGGGGGVAADSLAHGFAASRGRLLFPVVGRAEIHPAHREGTQGPGLELHAAAGAVVRAVFSGRVAFADQYGSYGRIVILDHGDHYYTVSGNLNEIDVKLGQDVDAGERIGTVGDDGRGPMLYFEVRHGSQTVAPGPWLGI